VRYCYRCDRVAIATRNVIIRPSKHTGIRCYIYPQAKNALSTKRANLSCDALLCQTTSSFVVNSLVFGEGLWLRDELACSFLLVTAAKARWPYISDSQKTRQSAAQTADTGGPPARTVGVGSGWGHSNPIVAVRGITPENFLKLCMQFSEFWCICLITDEYESHLIISSKSGNRAATGRGVKNGTIRRPVWCQKFTGTDTAKRGLFRKKTGTDGHLILKTTLWT